MFFSQIKIVTSNLFILFYSIFSCCIKSGNQPQEYLAKYVYKINRKMKNLEILLNVGQPLELNVATSKDKTYKLTQNPLKT